MRAVFSRFAPQAAMKTLQDQDLSFGLPDNVVAFPRACRSRPAPTGETAHSPSRAARPTAMTGAEMNARLLVLLGICTTSAAIVLSTVHFLQG
jgi:hypothetical protein